MTEAVLNSQAVDTDWDWLPSLLRLQAPPFGIQLSRSLHFSHCQFCSQLVCGTRDVKQTCVLVDERSDCERRGPSSADVPCPPPRERDGNISSLC